MARMPQHVYDPHDERPVTAPDLKELEGVSKTPAELLERIPTMSEEERDKLHSKKDKDSKESSSSLAEAEESAINEKPEAQEHEDQFPGGYKGKSPQQSRLKSLIRKRRVQAATGVATLLSAAVIFFFATLSGPLQFMHFSQLLQRFHFSNNENFSDGRSTRTMIYALTGRANQTRLGFVTNKVADRWENRLVRDTGLKPVYTAGANRFAGFEVVNEGRARDYLADFDKDGINTNAKPGNLVTKNGSNLAANGRVVDLRDEKYRYRRTVIRSVGNGTSTSKVAGAIGSRLLIKRGGVDFAPLKNIVRKGVDKATYKVERRNDTAVRDKSGVNVVIPKKQSASNLDENGDGVPDGTAADREAAAAANQLIDEGGVADGQGAAGNETLKKLKAGLSKGATPAAIIGALCAAKSFGDDVKEYQYTSTIPVMTRMGFRMIATGEQVETGINVNRDELEAAADSLTERDTDGNGPDKGSTWAQARSIQYEQGKPLTGPDIPVEARPDKVNGKPVFFQILDNIPLLNKTCGVASAIGGLPIIKQVGGLASDVVLSAVNAALGPFGYNVESFLEGAVSMIAGRGVDPYAEGAAFGNLANYGARLAANDHAISMGGRELDDTEVAMLDSRQRRDDLYDRRNRSFAQRYFDLYDSESLISKFIDKAPSSPGQLATNMGKLPQIFLNTITNTFNVALPRAQAATGYNYGFPEYGFSAIEQSDPRFENPFENAENIEPRLDELNDKYGECFSMKIVPDSLDPERLNLESGGAARYDKIPDKCKDSEDIDLLSYRFFLADLVTAHSLACYEGEDESCDNLGLDASPSTNPNVPASSDGAIDTANLFKDSTKVACDSRTRDLGIQDGYTNGSLVKIRICALPNLPSTGGESNGGYGVSGGNGDAIVNSRVSGAFYSLVEAAKKEGHLQRGAASTFRTMAHQQSLCAGNALCSSGNYTIVAKPGTSNHQLGIAIDFYINNLGITTSQCINIGGKCTAKGHSDWEWLDENADNFGIKQYINEFWHWSPTGN